MRSLCLHIHDDHYVSSFIHIHRTWEEGKVLIFDDSFEHEVWQEAETYRLVLIVDFWHPELTENQKRYLSPI